MIIVGCRWCSICHVVFSEGVIWLVPVFHITHSPLRCVTGTCCMIWISLSQADPFSCRTVTVSSVALCFSAVKRWKRWLWSVSFICDPGSSRIWAIPHCCYFPCVLELAVCPALPISPMGTHVVHSALFSSVFRLLEIGFTEIGVHLGEDWWTISQTGIWMQCISNGYNCSLKNFLARHGIRNAHTGQPT